MNNPAGIFSRIMSGIARALPYNLLSKPLGQRLIAPFYHAVSDDPMPHIRHLYRVKTVTEFERDLDFLLKHYRPIDFHELPDIIEPKSKRIGKPPMLLSFDDGLREFYDPIAPLLLKKGIPAICFLNSGFLDNQDLFFRYKASLLIEHITGRGNESMIGKIRSTAYSGRDYLDELAAELGMDFNDFLQQFKPYLTTEQVESLLKKGFHFGAHSVDHPEYRFLDLTEQLRQTTKSIETISNKFGLGYRLFSFPFTDFGVSRKFFEVVLDEKKIAGYTFGCAGLKKDIHPHQIQRIPLETNQLPTTNHQSPITHTAEDVLRKEFLYFWLKMPFGKNRIRRT